MGAREEGSLGVTLLPAPCKLSPRGVKTVFCYYITVLIVLRFFFPSDAFALPDEHFPAPIKPKGGSGRGRCVINPPTFGFNPDGCRRFLR
jgi:hypothetical protein